MGAVCSTSTPRGEASSEKKEKKGGGGTTSVLVNAASNTTATNTPPGPAVGLRVKVTDDDPAVSNSSPNPASSAASTSSPIAIVRRSATATTTGPQASNSASTPEERRMNGADTTKSSGRPSPTHASTPPSGSSHGLLLQAPGGSNNTPPASSSAAKYAFPPYAGSGARHSPKAQPQHSPSSRAMASPVLISTSDIAPVMATSSFTFHNARPSFSSNGTLPAPSTTNGTATSNSNNNALQAGGSPLGRNSLQRKSNRMSLGALNPAASTTTNASGANSNNNLHLYPDLESFTFQLGGGITSSNGGQAESVTTPHSKPQHLAERESFTTPPPTNSGSNAATPNVAVSTTPKMGPQPSLHSPLTRNSLTGNPRRYSFGPNSGFTVLNTTPNGSPAATTTTLASPLSHQQRLSGSFSMNTVQNSVGTSNTASSAAAAGSSPPGPGLSRTFTNNSSTNAAAQAARFRIGGSPVLAPMANRASMGFSSPVVTALCSSPKDRPDEGGVVAPPLDLGAPSQPSVGRTRSLSNANKRYSLNMSNPSALATSPQSIFNSELRRSSGIGLSGSPVKASLVQFNNNGGSVSNIRHSPTNSIDPLNPPQLFFPQSSGGSISSTSSSPPPAASTPSINAAPVTPTQLTFPALPSPAFSAMSTSNSMNSLSNSAFNSISLASMPSSANTTNPSSPNQPNGRSFVPALKRSHSEDSVSQQAFPHKLPLVPQQLEPLRVEP